MSLQDQGIKWAKLWKQLPQASTGRHLWLCGQGPFLGQGSAPWRLLVSDAYLTCIPQCWPRAWLGSKWLLERLDNNFEKHQCFLFFFFSFIYSSKLLWDHQRVCFHTVEHTSPTELTRALELSWNSFRHPGGGLWVGGLWVSLPKKKHCFLSVFHVGLLCKIYQREGSMPQINLKTIVRRLERHCQRGQRGNGFIRQCVWLTSWQKRPFERLWKLVFTGLVLAFLSWLLLLLASHSFACLPSSWCTAHRAFCKFSLLILISLAWNIDPFSASNSGNFIFLYPILASSWVSSPFFALTSGNCVPKCFLPSWILAPPGDFQLSQLSPEQLFLNWDLKMGFILAEWGSRICCGTWGWGGSLVV